MDKKIDPNPVYSEIYNHFADEKRFEKMKDNTIKTVTSQELLSKSALRVDNKYKVSFDEWFDPKKLQDDKKIYLIKRANKTIMREYRKQKINKLHRRQFIVDNGLYDKWLAYNQECDEAEMDTSESKRLYWFCKMHGYKM